MQLYILFYTKHVIRKTCFLKPQDLSEEKFVFFSSSCAWITEHFSLPFLMKDTCFGTLSFSWKILALKAFLIIPLLCLFYFANHVYRKDITSDILWIKTYSLQCNKPLKIQLYKNLAILFVIIFKRLTQNQSRRKHVYQRSVIGDYLNVTKRGSRWLLFSLVYISSWELCPP